MGTNVIDRMRQRLGPVGVWAGTMAGAPPNPAVERAELARIEALGYTSAWNGETIGGREVFARHGLYLAATENLVVGSGIATVWARHPATMQGGGALLAEAYPGRFVLGIGIGHPVQAERTGGDYRQPLRIMREYLDEMDSAAKEFPPAEPFPRILAALGPKMLELSRERADGAHPFFTPVSHTAFAREILGPDKLLIPQLTVLLERDPVHARGTARELMRRGSGISPYVANFRRFGYTDSDIADGSDRLVDAVVAWGDEEAVRHRVREHLDAGADHVLVTPIGADLPSMVDQLARLAPALLGVAA
jgi:probable F420-dependent oxidoreductase